MCTLISRSPKERAVASRAPAAAPQIATTLPRTLLPDGVTRVLYDTSDEGLVFARNSDQPVRRVRSRSRETLQWKDSGHGRFASSLLSDRRNRAHSRLRPIIINSQITYENKNHRIDRGHRAAPHRRLRASAARTARTANSWDGAGATRYLRCRHLVATVTMRNDQRCL